MLTRRAFTVLALESSADDTCAAIVTSARHILSNVVIKQHDVHEQFGGIHPAAAVLAHQRNMPTAVRRALDDAALDMSAIDGVAFTRGPGIGGCLGVCSNAAKSLAAALNKPLVGVHHMVAHALTPLLTSPSAESSPQFPFLTLLVSGGHTLLLLAKSETSFRILATTRDESIGRTFDKISRLLQLPWSGRGPGPALEQFCADPTPGELPLEFPAFPRPLHAQLAFSYSSFHSHLERYLFRTGGIHNLSLCHKLAIGREFQRSAFRQLEDKLMLALEDCERNQIQIRHLVVSGGVASNMLLRERLSACLTNTPIQVVFPPAHLCTDNAAMIAWASMGRFLSADHDPYTISPRTKWSIEDLHLVDDA